jgi:hypothetical protein
VTNLNKLFKWLAMLSTLIALFVFLFSIISPFYNCLFTSFPSAMVDEATYWSYRADMLFNLPYFSTTDTHFWFFNYWFDANNQGIIGSLGMLWIPLAMFVMQVLTLAFGCASLVIKRRTIRSVPICSSLIVLALMSYVGYRLSTHISEGAYQLGYYLVYPSIILFAFAFVLSEVRARYLQS